VPDGFTGKLRVESTVDFGPIEVENEAAEAKIE
jgi:hypothetical protein